jgi:hypothetical protein
MTRGPENQMWDRTERAQVFARDIRRPGTDPLVYLARGGAETLRQDARDRHLVCPLPDCDQPLLWVRAGSRRDHFAHRTEPCSDHGAERLMHLQGKAMIAAWLRDRYPGLRVALEVPIGDRDRVADVLALNPATGGRMAFEIQYSQLTVSEWRERHDTYRDRGITDVWLWGHLPPHCKRVRGDEQGGERCVTPVMLECAGATGRPPLWINPEERMLAVGALCDDTPDEHDLARSWEFFDQRAAIPWAAPVEQWSLDREAPSRRVCG